MKTKPTTLLQSEMNEIEKEFDDNFTFGGITGTVAFNKDKYRPYEIKYFYRKSFKALATKLVESFGEIIDVKFPDNGCDWKHDKLGIEADICDTCEAIEKAKTIIRSRLAEVLEKIKEVK
jgi:hypothetical protein